MPNPFQSSEDFFPILKTHLNQQHIEGPADAQVHRDPAQIPTVGAGINLDDPANQFNLENKGYNLQDIKSGAVRVEPEHLDETQNEAIQRKTREAQARIGDDLFSSLSPQQKAGVISLYYNSNKLLGPKLIEGLAKQDPEKILNEVLLRSNPDKSPGVLARRIEEAKLLVSQKDFDTYMEFLAPETKQKLHGILSKTENEERRTELLNQYGPMLDIGPKPAPFLKIKKLFNPTR
jgi:GH24 family phage-related lysozyme (muramidase)